MHFVSNELGKSIISVCGLVCILSIFGIFFFGGAISKLVVDVLNSGI